MDMIKLWVPGFEVFLYAFAKASEQTKTLIYQAIDARNKGDQPVSKFHVGAAIQVTWCKHSIYPWANCENVNFNGSTHAEQCAVNSALMEKSTTEYGGMAIQSIAVVGAMDEMQFDKISDLTQTNLATLLEWKKLEEIMDSFCTPCGHCRQIIAPYSTANTQVHLVNPQWIVAQLPFRNLLPFPFLQIK